MAKGKTTSKAASSDRKTHSWSKAQLRFLAENPSTPRSELIAEFRSRWPGAKVSDTGIQGRRYRILRDGSSRHPELGGTALQARVDQLREELAQAEAALAAHEAKQVDSRPTAAELGDMTKAQLLDVAAEHNVEVAKSWSKAQLIEAIAA